jgi:hypothetical protein
MGEVYRDRHAKLSRDVALKVLPAEHRLDRVRQRDLLEEALALALQP